MNGAQRDGQINGPDVLLPCWLIDAIIRPSVVSECQQNPSPGVARRVAEVDHSDVLRQLRGGACTLVMPRENEGIIAEQ